MHFSKRADQARNLYASPDVVSLLATSTRSDGIEKLKKGEITMTAVLGADPFRVSNGEVSFGIAERRLVNCRMQLTAISSRVSAELLSLIRASLDINELSRASGYTYINLEEETVTIQKGLVALSETLTLKCGFVDHFPNRNVVRSMCEQTLSALNLELVLTEISYADFMEHRTSDLDLLLEISLPFVSGGSPVFDSQTTDQSSFTLLHAMSTALHNPDALPASKVVTMDALVDWPLLGSMDYGRRLPRVVK
jgi:hypothetical protein